MSQAIIEVLVFSAATTTAAKFIFTTAKLGRKFEGGGRAKVPFK